MSTCQRGATAVEFAIVTPPLLVLIFAIIELALAFTMSVCLSNATSIAARKLRVGQFVAPGVAATTSSGSALDLADFKTQICNNIPLAPLSTCQQSIQVDVRTVSAFSGLSAPNPISGGTFNTSNLCYYSGTAGNIIEVRSYYLWPIATPLILSPLVNVTTLSSGSGSTTGNWFAVSSTEVFKNEPNPNISNNSSGC